MMITKLHLTPNEWSRPQRPIRDVRAIVLHWVQNPGTSARANRDFFEMRKDGRHGYGSAHFIADDTEIVACIPIGEMAYHVGASEYTDFARMYLGPYPNSYTIGIEMCHPTDTGEPTPVVWEKTVELTSELLLAHALRPHHITTHHNITGKRCHRWFVDHPAELERFRWAVASRMGIA